MVRPRPIVRLTLAAACLVGGSAASRAPAASAAPPASQPARVTVHPVEDPDIVLHNLDMGWTLYENYPLDQRPGGTSTLLTVPDDDYPGADAVALMFTWADVERTPDHYDFSKVDYAYDYWHKRGKRIHLRMSTESLLWWNTLTPPAGTGVPGYLLDQLPPAAKQTRTNEGVPYTVVDARDPLYRRRLEKFLAAVANHFGARRPVTLIDLRGFGLWGEWHSGFHYPSLEQKRTALSGIVDRWSAAFPRHWLALSYSFDPDGSDNVSYDDYVRFSAFDYALTKANVTLRRDGCGGAVRPNERRLADETFATLTRGPMSCEFVTWYGQEKPQGKKRLREIVDDALALHPNYINLLGYQSADARNFLREQPDLIAYGLRNMGYRLVPTSITYPTEITPGSPAAVDTTWTNRAVGRAMRDFHLFVFLTDAGGKPIATADAGPVPSSKWVKGRESDVPNLHFQLPHFIRPGSYTFRIALRDDGGRPIALPLRGESEHAYPVGPITVR